MITIYHPATNRKKIRFGEFAELAGISVTFHVDGKCHATVACKFEGERETTEDFTYHTEEVYSGILARSICRQFNSISRLFWVTLSPKEEEAFSKKLLEFAYEATKKVD